MKEDGQAPPNAQSYPEKWLAAFLFRCLSNESIEDVEKNSEGDYQYLVVYGVIPVIIGWFGIVASIIYSFGNGIVFVKPNFKVLWNLGGLLILLFEIVLGGSLVYYSII